MPVAIQEVFKVGKAPTEKGLVHKAKHPDNTNKQVRCIMQKDELFFNVGDFVNPYKNPLYKIAVMTCLPKAQRNLSQIWMAQRAWVAISNVVKKKMGKVETENVILEGLRTGTLFPEKPKAKTTEGTKSE